MANVEEDFANEVKAVDSAIKLEQTSDVSV